VSRAALPLHLYAAYNWTEAAGELDELADIVSDPVWLASYARASAECAAEADLDLGTKPDVFACDIVALAEWLAAEKAKDAADGCDNKPNYDFLVQWGGYDSE
jgi:hypothetical protein